MDVLGPVEVGRHYHSVAATVVGHLADRPVISAGWTGSGPSRVGSQAELHAAVQDGCRWFAVPAEALRPWSLLRLVPGPGADTATTATVALALLETVPDGTGIAIGDGANGMVVALPEGHDAAMAADDLAGRAPELATGEPGQDEGRVLVSVLTGADP